MECPKCHTKVDENQTKCPTCHKVLQLECPNCHRLGESAICQSCGYTILVKCSKCSKMVPVTKGKCPKCGYPTATSLGIQECESDDFASIVIKFGALKVIKRLLKSKELYSKFFFKLKNLLYAQVKGSDCKFITYGEEFVINLNKELSLATSSNKAVRLALKIANAFAGLNLNVLEELSTPLNLNITIVRKTAENLQNITTYESNVKALNIKKDTKKYLKGIQIILDQYISDEISKDYKLDSVYTIEQNHSTTTFYEIILDSYVLPPSDDKVDNSIQAIEQTLPKEKQDENKKDLYSFKVFDINAKCSFDSISTASLTKKLENLNLEKEGKILGIKTSNINYPKVNDIVNFYKKNDYIVLKINCTEELTYKPWGIFENLFREYFKLPFHNKFLDLSEINKQSLNSFKQLFEYILGNPIKAMSPEDARFGYMESWNKFLSSLSKTAILIEGFENIDDTTIQTLELYFDKFKNIKPNFVFITNEDVSVHSKIKGLLRTNLYTEISLHKSSIDACLATIKSDATDFIQSFYFEKIKENFKGSFLYFINAIEYLKETNILIEFEDKLIVQSKKSAILSRDLFGIYKSRIKNFSKNIDMSFIFAYTSILGPRLDIGTLKHLGIKDLEKNIETLIKANFITFDNGAIFFYSFGILKNIITSSLKQEAENYLVKNVIAQLGKDLDSSSMALTMGRIAHYKEEYLTLWKNSQFSIKVGDFDAYLKNCLGFLSLVEHIETTISENEIEENKKDVYNNILVCLYAYSPAKIYFIENILLMDAINLGDDEKIVKLSNLMLQGALISSNYTDALGLLHNILSRMANPTLLIDGVINTKFLLLSLVNIEILYNIGDFRQCVEIAQEILSVISLNILDKIKPASFSTNLFISHILETLRLVGFAKLFLMDDDIENFLEDVELKLETPLPEKDCILAIRDYLSGKVYNTSNIEEYSPYSKIIFLILQEFSLLNNDYKRFAQNIYQAKLLAADIHNVEIELFCDLLIAYAYSKIDIIEKANSIYYDVLDRAEKAAMYNIILLTKYLIAKNTTTSKTEEALLLINDSLAMIRKYDNTSKIFFALFEKLYIETISNQNVISVDLEIEEEKISSLKDKLVAIIG